MPRTWTEAQRQAASKRAIIQRPWEKSTGPRTLSGKQRAARNSYKHGYYSAEKQVLRWYVRLSALRLKQLKAQNTLIQQKRRNELIDSASRYGLRPSIRPDWRILFDFIRRNPLQNRGRILINSLNSHTGLGRIEPNSSPFFPASVADGPQ